MSTSSEKFCDWFETEVKVIEPELRGFLTNNLPQGIEVDDVVQESFLRILKMRRRGGIKSPKATLFTIARNLRNDHFRNKYKQNNQSLVESDNSRVLDTKEPIHATVSRAEEYEILKDAIRSLPKRCQMIFVYHHYDRLSHKQIADRMQITVNTVQAQLTLGRIKCRDYFELNGYL